MVGIARSGNRLEIALVRLEPEPALVRRLGGARGDVAWSPEATRVAWCGPDANTLVLDLPTGRGRSLAGCRPAIGADGAVLTRPEEDPALVLRDGRPLLTERDLVRGVGAIRDSRLEVRGYDVSGTGLLAVAVLASGGGRTPLAVLELWRRGEIAETIRLPGAAPANAAGGSGLVELGPGGDEAIVRLGRSGLDLTVVDLRTGRILLSLPSHAGVSWSPDGAWLAVSTGKEIEIYGAARSAPVYVLPLPAGAIAWH